MVYELTFLISPDLAENEALALQEEITSLIQEGSGLIEESKIPFKKGLAFPIKKKNQAYLSSLKFQLEPQKLASLTGKIKTKQNILRYLLLTKRRLKETKRPSRSFFIKREAPKQKVELKEIEKKIEEILGE